MRGKTQKNNKKINEITNKTNGSSKKIMSNKKTNKIIEYEGRILNIDPVQFRKQLISQGAKLKGPLTLYRRSVFNLCDVKRGFVRIRDEGDKITLTSKIYKNPDFPEEYELSIKETFEKGQEFLRSLNLTEKAYHETIREKWSLPRVKKAKVKQLDGKHLQNELCEISIDYIPGLPVYAELECKSHVDLINVCKILNIKYTDLAFGGYGKVFVEYYGMAENDINNIIPRLTFGNTNSEIGKYIHKNQNILKKAIDDNMIIYKSLGYKNN